MMHAVASPGAHAARLRIDGALLTAAYAGLIVYGSLYPFSGWESAAEPFAFFLRPLTETRFSLGDLFTNLFAYVPLGLLICRHLRRSMHPLAAVLFATAAGLVLSVAVELVQAFLPSRVQSNLDLLMNTAGTALGALAAVAAIGDGQPARWVRELRTTWLAKGVLADLAVIGLSAWALSRLVPFVPSLDVGKFRASLAPLAAAFRAPHSVSLWLALSEALSWSAFGLILRSIVRPDKRGGPVLILFAAFLLLARVPIVGLTLTAEGVMGGIAGMLLASLLASAPPRRRGYLAFFLLFAGFCIAETVSAPPATLYPFNWVPFRGHMINTTNGIASLLDAIGICVALAWAARYAASAGGRRATAWLGGLLVVVGALVLELAQRRIPGRAGDVTIPLLFAFTWIAAWRATPGEIADTRPQPASAPAAKPPPAAQQSLRASVVHYASAWAGLTAAIWLITQWPSVPYNVRELIYAGHPWRSAAFLAAGLALTIGAPAAFISWSLHSRGSFFLWPIALVLNAYLVWLLAVNAVPSESIHDIVGAPVLGWPGQIEECVRFLGLHSAVSVAVTGGVVVALLVFHRARGQVAAQWLAWACLLAPLLHWVIVTEAATDNLTELMRNGGSLKASAVLGLAATLTFASGSVLSATLSLARHRPIGIAVAVACAVAAYLLYQTGSDTAVIKYGKVFSAMQFLLSPDRTRYVTGGELVARYAIAYLSLVAAVILLQQPAWRAIVARKGHL